MTKPSTPPCPSPLEFFGHLRWIDGRPLLDTIEPYRRDLFMRVLYEFRDDGSPRYNMALVGRAKKNNKTSDLVLAALYRLVVWESAQGNDGFILANDEGQAGDDLSLAKKIVEANPDLADDLDVLAKEIRRRDGAGSLQILPARDAAGAHGKTSLFVGFDEIHGIRSWDIFEALAPDPTRADALTWITSYDTIYNSPGIPLYDLKRTAMKGDDPRMLFSWYSGDVCTDPAFAALPQEQRANPSMASWPEGAAYLEQQRRRLPTHRFRRLHLNLPGAPEGAFFSADKVIAAIDEGVSSRPYRPGVKYHGFVDMSGGSADDAVLAIAHDEGGTAVLDLLMKQAGPPPFNPRHAVSRFADALKAYHLRRVTGDAYAGLTFRADFQGQGITYDLSQLTKSALYDALEPRLNAGEVVLLDTPKLQEQLLTLVMRGARIDHMPGDHDDHANAAAGALWLASPSARHRRGVSMVDYL